MKKATANARFANPEWRKRQIILDPELVARLEEWHGGQFTAVYSLVSTGSHDLVSLSMIDAAMDELEADLRKTKGEERMILRDAIGDLAGIRQFWREHTAKEAGMDLAEDEYKYDHADYGMDPEEEAEIDTRSG
jgi:hypothetical protein